MHKMLRIFGFPWYLARLIALSLPTLLAIAWLPYRRWENALTAILLLGLVGLITMSLYPTLLSKYPPTTPLITLLRPNHTELQQQLKLHTELYHRQPTDRDILINLSLLHRALGNTTQADEFWHQAQELDPNYGLFN